MPFCAEMAIFLVPFLPWAVMSYRRTMTVISRFSGESNKPRSLMAAARFSLHKEIRTLCMLYSNAAR